MIRKARAAVALLAASLVLAGCGAAIVPQVRNEGDRVTVARRLYERGEYSLCVDVLSNYVTTGGGAADIDQAVYLLGLAYMGQRDYTNAQAQFERMARDYPESDSASAAAYRLGVALYGQSRGPDFDQEFTLKAMAQWEGVVQSDADASWQELARQRITECRARLAHKLWRTGDVYLKLKLYEPAKVYFGSIIRDYSDTPPYGEALIGNAIADARLGRRDSAMTLLSELATEFAGRPLGTKAAETLAKVRRWPAEGDRGRRRHRTVEPTQPAPSVPTPSTTTPFAP